MTQNEKICILSRRRKKAKNLFALSSDRCFIAINLSCLSLSLSLSLSQDLKRLCVILTFGSLFNVASKMLSPKKVKERETR